MAEPNVEQDQFLHALIKSSGALTANELFSMFIHRLNNFLFVVAGRIELAGEDPAQKDKALTVVRDQVIKLKESIEHYETIKDFCQPKLQEGNLAECLTSTVELARMTLLSPNLCLDIGNGIPTIHFDHAQLSCALYHILENAVRASGLSAPVNVHLSLEGELVLLWIENPISRTEDKADLKMFDLYYTQNQGCLGAGLGIVKRVLRFHNFEYDFAAQEDSNIFMIKIPRK